MNTQIGLYAKSIVAALLAGLTALYTALNDNPGGAQWDIADHEWITVAIAVVTALGVWAVPNSVASTTTRVRHRNGGGL